MCGAVRGCVVRVLPLPYGRHDIFRDFARIGSSQQFEGHPNNSRLCLQQHSDQWVFHNLSPPLGYVLGSYRIATAPELNSSRLTSLKSTCFDSPANHVGPWPASLGCTTNSYSSINPSSANASGRVTPASNSPLPDSRLNC